VEKRSDGGAELIDLHSHNARNGGRIKVAEEKSVIAVEGIGDMAAS
jgi:hypothetical protein